MSMLSAANSWPQNTVLYDAFFGPNSNTAAQQIGAAGGFNPAAPPGSFGW
jgi:hypothetical protein